MEIDMALAKPLYKEFSWVDEMNRSYFIVVADDVLYVNI